MAGALWAEALLLPGARAEDAALSILVKKVGGGMSSFMAEASVRTG